MKSTLTWIAAFALAASCAAATPAPEEHVHAAAAAPAEAHACMPPAVAPDALSNTPHTPGRPEIRYYVIGDA